MICSDATRDRCPASHSALQRVSLNVGRAKVCRALTMTGVRAVQNPQSIEPCRGTIYFWSLITHGSYLVTIPLADVFVLREADHFVRCWGSSSSGNPGPRLRLVTTIFKVLSRHQPDSWPGFPTTLLASPLLTSISTVDIGLRPDLVQGAGMGHSYAVQQPPNWTAYHLVQVGLTSYLLVSSLWLKPHCHSLVMHLPEVGIWFL